jgi:hypothetical protein
MSDLILTESQRHQFDILNSLYESNKSTFTKILTFDSLVNEAHAIQVIESNIPDNLRFDLHLNMILKEGTATLTDYYKSMAGGTNYILEAARKVFPENQSITESIESFKEYLGSLINEQSLALGNAGFDAALAGGSIKPRTSGGFWTTLKSLWDAVTEGGSIIGIIQFIIDIIGLVGDFIFPGVGVVADLLNAIIYAVRGEWMLCAISLIAAVLIGGGDALKLLKGAARPAEKVFMASLKGEKAAAAELAKVPAKDKGGVVKLLTYIFGNIGSVVGKGISLLGKFSENFGKVTKWIPGLGKGLNWIFEGLGKTLKTFGEKMTLSSANFKLATKSAKESAAMSIDAAVKAGGDFIVDGPWIIVKDSAGKQIGKYPAKQVEKVSGKTIAELTAKKAGQQVSKEVTEQASRSAIKASSSDSLRRRMYSYFKTNPLLKGSSRFVKDLPFFVGKQIYKLIFGTDWVDGANAKWSRREVEGHGNGALNHWISEKLRAERKKTGAVYIPALVMDSQDEETVDKITDYQNHFAKLHGQPTIMNVVTKKYDSSGANSEFDEFFDLVGKGEIKRGGAGDIVGESKASQTFIKTISNFSDFK